MAYVLFDAGFPEHPKMIALSDSAFRLWVSGVAYCVDYLTDGVVPKDKVRGLVPQFKKRALDELVSGGHWRRNSRGDYVIHDFLDWNRSRAEVQQLSERNRKAARQRWNQ